MVSNNLLTGILLGGMIPITPPPQSNSESDLLRVNRAVEVFMLLYKSTVSLLDAKGSKTMKVTDKQAASCDGDHKGGTELEGPLPYPYGHAAELEIVAAIITAGMLPQISIPKLRRLNEALKDEDYRPAADVFAAALNLYHGILSTLKMADEELSGMASLQ